MLTKDTIQCVFIPRIQIPELHEEDICGVTIRITVESVILDGIVKSVVMCHYVQMVLEGNVIDSAGGNM